MDELLAAAGPALRILADYAAGTRAGSGPAVARREPDEVAADLDLHRLIREGGLDAEGFGPWLERYLADGVRLHHPAQLAHQVASPDLGAALADVVHGVANQPMSIYEMGAAAASVEHAVVRWMLEKVGFDPTEGGGVLTHGGSLANLTALAAARAAAAPDAWRNGAPHDLAILAPPSAHYSVRRAAGLLGLGEDAVVDLEMDELERIRVDRLEDGLTRARAAGRRPMALVAGVCATTTGLHDDLEAIADFCERHGIWLHADGAHGASALLSPRLRGRLAGVERADSVVWDAHKMLRTTAVCAAVLVRRGDRLPGAFHQHAAYLELGNPDGVDTIDRQVECTKAELGLKVFLNLAFRGEAGMASYVEGRYALAERLWEMLQERPGFSAPYRPESNILCFAHGEPGPEQARIRDALLARGEFHLSSSEIAGRRYLRVAIMAPATDENTLGTMLDAVEKAARAVPSRA